MTPIKVETTQNDFQLAPNDVQSSPSDARNYGICNLFHL